MFGNFGDPEVQGSRSPLLQPLLVAASDLQELVVAVRESKQQSFTINTILYYTSNFNMTKVQLPASLRAWAFRRST